MCHQWFKLNVMKLYDYKNNFCAPKKKKMIMPLSCMEGQKALEFHQRYLNLCSEDEQRSYGFRVGV